MLFLRVLHWSHCITYLILIGGPIWVNSLAFDSIASLKSLVINEDSLVKAVQEYLKKQDDMLKQMRGQLDTIASRTAQKKTLDHEEWEDYVMDLVEHPLDALKIIKDWSVLSKMAADQTNHVTAMTSSAEMLGVTMPEEIDYSGAMAAILRLQKTYNLQTEDVAAGKIHNVTARYRMDSTDLLTMGRLYMDVEHGAAISWFETYLNQSDQLTEGTKEAYENSITIYQECEDYERAYNTSKKLLQIDPDNEILQQNMSVLQTKIEVQKSSGKPIRKKPFWKNMRDRSLEYYESLCRGERTTNNILLNKDLICVYRRGLLPYVQYKEEIHSISPRISLFIDVITDRQADFLKSKALPKLKKALVGGAYRIESNSRIGKLSWLHDIESKVTPFSKKVADITGMSTQYKDKFADSESFQIVNYGMGGQYEPHHDFYDNEFLLSRVPNFIFGTGDRIATFMFYLSDVTAGGATVFPRIGVRVPPIKNAAAYWYNYDLAGEVGDPKTLHAGCPVLLGQKWVGNKWIRQGGQTFRRRCGLSKDEIDPIFYS